MSLLKALQEAEPVFKAATPDEQKKRRADAMVAALKGQKFIPIDQEALDLDMKVWTAMKPLMNILGRLKNKYCADNQGMCVCDLDVLADLGEEQEYAYTPGRHSDMVKQCLRCGGVVEE